MSASNDSGTEDSSLQSDDTDTADDREQRYRTYCEAYKKYSPERVRDALRRKVPLEAVMIGACQTCDLEVVEFLLEVHPILLKCTADITDNAGITLSNVTPLVAASYNGYIYIAESILQRSSEVLEHPKAYTQPLKAACAQGHLEIVKRLITYGASVNATEDFSSLMLACYGQYHDLVHYLLEQGADVNYRVPEIESLGNLGQNSGMTALHMCALRGDVEQSKKLLEHGAQYIGNFKGETPAVTAAWSGHEDYVTYLMNTDICPLGDIPDALEILGALKLRPAALRADDLLFQRHDTLTSGPDPQECVRLWSRALDKRLFPGQAIICKREAAYKVAAYRNAVEMQTRYDLDDCQSTEELWIQAMLICERIFGPTNRKTTYMLIEFVNVMCRSNEFGRGLELILHCLDNLYHTNPFKTTNIAVYANVFIVLSKCLRLGIVAPVSLKIGDLLNVLRRLMLDFVRGEAKLRTIPMNLHMAERDELLSIILKTIYLFHNAFDQFKPEELARLSDYIKYFVSMDFRGLRGETLLHMAVDGEVIRVNFHGVSLEFPDIKVVQALLDAGCDPTARDEVGKTPLQYIVGSSPDVPECWSNIVQLLKSAEQQRGS